MTTMTCNPLWPEIVQNSLQGQQVSDRPDLCCRVFKIKHAVLMSHLKSGKVFGPYDYHMSVIEYQKRGLPHALIIITFKIAGPDLLNQMESWVWAQLLHTYIAGGKLREMVLKNSIHKPCGFHNVNALGLQTNRDTNTKSCESTTSNLLEHQLHSMNAVGVQNVVGQTMATILPCETKLTTPGLMFL